MKTTKRSTRPQRTIEAFKRRLRKAIYSKADLLMDGDTDYMTEINEIIKKTK